MCTLVKNHTILERIRITVRYRGESSDHPASNLNSDRYSSTSRANQQIYSRRVRFENINSRRRIYNTN